MKVLLTVCFVLYVQCFVHAQQKQLTGLLKGSTGKPTVNIPVMLKNGQDRIVRFAYSNVEGKYTIALPDTAHPGLLYLEVNGINYNSRRQQLEEGRLVYDFLLEEKVTVLPEVKVTGKPLIITQGDTLSYNVHSFEREEDRSIGDVIRRLPGITVAEDGQISYNGKPIFNLYIHGDDLMDGRYGLATRTISKDMIKSVDVIRNYQPLKVFLGKVFTGNVAMNLVLKDELGFRLSGQAMVGAGLPEQFDAALNGIVLNRQFKMLNSLQGNNTGVDYRNDFKQLSSQEFLNTINNTHPANLLSMGTSQAPDLPRSNYYLNRSATMNANNLFNTKKGLQIRSNLLVFLDRNTSDYHSTVDYYLSGDTIRYNERQIVLNKPYIISTSLTAMVNKKGFFLNNTFRARFEGEKTTGFLNFNGKDFGQRLHQQILDLSNEFNWVPALKRKGIIELKWYINSYSNLQFLDINSGLQPDILNNGRPYAAAMQHVETPALSSHILFSYRTKDHLIKQNYLLGVINERQQLNSSLNLTQLNSNVTDYTGDQGNALHWRHDKIYLNALYDIKKDSWDAALSLPLAWQSIHYGQNEYALGIDRNRFYVNPSARLKLYFNAEDHLSLSYSYNNTIGDISGVYRGLILANYQSLLTNDAGLQEKYTSSSGMYYNFQRSIIMLFIYAGLNYNKIKAGFIASSVLTDNIRRIILLPYENDQSTLSANAGISKYLFALKTTASLKTVFRKANFTQFINSDKLPFFNNNIILTVATESKFLNSFILSYNGTGNWITGKKAVKDAGNKMKSKVKRFDQNIALGHSPVNNLFLTIKGRHLYSSQANASNINYLFLDANLRYKHTRWRTDLEFDVTNIANVKNYEVFTLSSNQFTANRFEIRGRMAVLKAMFNL